MRIIIFLLFTFFAFGSDPFRLVNHEMKNGNYIYSLVILRNIKGDNQILAKRYFLEGICYTQVGEYAKALNRYLEAKKLNIPILEYYYELGKTLYFAKELDKSKKSFLVSIKNQSQIAGSLFYLSRIAQLEKDLRQAKIYLKQILDLKNQNPQVIQDALFQLGDIHLKIAKDELMPKDLKEIVSKHVLPYYEQALKASPTSFYSKKIEERVEMIRKKYDLI